MLLSRPLSFAALVAIAISLWLSVTLLSALARSDRDLHRQHPTLLTPTTASPISRLQGLLGTTLLGKPTRDACAGWDPHASEEHDPPGCLRARQLRQIQAMRRSGLKLDAEQEEPLNQLERCALGVRQCPERPLIISDFWYFFVRRRSNSGESIWLDPVVDVIEDEGFVTMAFPHFEGGTEEMPPSWNATRMLSELLYMYLPTAQVGFQCLSDPRCIWPQDYHPHPNPALRHDTSLMLPHEVGTTPPWRVFHTSYWGDRPSRYSGQGQNAGTQFGQSVDQVSTWSSHLLDPRWHIVPWAYPNHTHLPLSIEWTCLSSPTVPWEQRNASVLVLGKLSHYFHMAGAPAFDAWGRIVAAMAAEGIELWTGAEEEPGHPLPAGLRRLPQMDRVAYGQALSGVRALLGIGNPQTSPSPFNSFCRGVPVVLPYYTDDGPTPGGWKMFKDAWTQNGPALAVGEPYAYAYRSVDDMIAQLRTAVRTPIKGFVPPDMSLRSVGAKTRAWLHHDWEAEYRAIRTQRRVIQYPPVMLEKCRESNTCRYPLLGHPVRPKDEEEE